MRAAKIILAFSMVWLVTGCPDKARHSSIEEMNMGITAAQSNLETKAIEHLKESTRLFPDNYQAWYTLGQIYINADKWEDAIEALNQAVRINPKDPMYQMWLGISNYENGNKSVAATHLEKSIELENRLRRAYYYLGRVYEDNDEPEKAAEAWSQAARIDPYDGRAFVRLGQLYLRWDMLDQAIKVLKQGAEYVKGDELTNVFYHLGLAYDGQEQWDNAITAYSQALDASQGNVDAKFQRGLSYAKKGDKSKARADLQEFAKSAADKPFKKQEANKVLMTLIAPE